MLQALGVDLEAPYFKVDGEYVVTGKCSHAEYGIRLDKTDRHCFCRNCGLQIDPFEALLYYAKAETRLVNARGQIEQARKSEENTKARAKERKQYARKVVGSTVVKDLSLKAEPITGKKLKLECGHVKDAGPDWSPKQVTCHECEAEIKQKKR